MLQNHIAQDATLDLDMESHCAGSGGCGFNPAAPHVQLYAQRLLNETGSAEVAQRASDRAASRRPVTSSHQDQFARQWGFVSYLDMFESSSPVPSNDRRHWCVTAVSGGDWILWNDDEFVTTRTFRTIDEAARQAPGSPLR